MQMLLSKLVIHAIDAALQGSKIAFNRIRGDAYTDVQLYALRQFQNGDSESFRQNIHHGQAGVLLASFHF
jgi:hypothetical protein